MNTIDGARDGAADARRVLLVDDSVDAAQAMSMLLETLGHDVRMLHDAAGALAIVDAFQPEVVILDIGLPVMDGCELARLLRARPSTRDALLLALTGYGGDADRQRALDAGFDHHLVKPVSFTDLEDLIARSFGPDRTRNV
ncbi:Chemotaxis protein methyltransferase CheR [Caballeronia glathei]|jgi:CheY-like chemotaxis protein|uniref:Histidine kinase n=1 Tax=Caballeronia glathei TaxID=60547 RepID=A0A069PJU3_9BURK|nr:MULTISPECIES: response regulator [Burkholderiaceae]KDR40875.1 histidine kinase [Caballeronia glathei]TCK41960.1 response regulator receiver domain-containing protein [Paraburkholderia sp. BL8N3]CDY73514.1 Chemotaxis protein methyltransferase CheR [Caballeronia glathei]